VKNFRRLGLGLLILLLCWLLVTAVIWWLGRRDKKIVEETTTYKIAISCPRFDNQLINDDLNKLIAANLTSFKRVPPPPPDDPRHYKNELVITHDRPGFSQRYLSLVFYVLTYTGGAHPNTIVITRNYDRASGRRLKLAEATHLPSSELKRLVVDQLLKEVDRPQKEWIRAGVTDQNLENFAVENGQLAFYFSPYAVTCYAAGVQKVKLDILKE
jgi:hypothetical protein